MKKFVFLTIAMLTMLSTGYSKSISVVTGDTIITEIPADTILSTAPVFSEAERLIDKYGGKFYDVLAALGEQLKVPAEYVYKIFTHQYQIEGMVYLITIIFFTILSIILFIIFMRMYRSGLNKCESDYAKENYCESFSGVMQIIGIVVSIIGIILTFIFLGVYGSQYCMQIYNPEFYVIKEIMSLVK